MLIRSVFAVSAFVRVVNVQALQAAETVTVTTLEWPPNTSQHLPKGGATNNVVRQAFAAAGFEVEVETVPCKRVHALRPDRERPARVR